ARPPTLPPSLHDALPIYVATSPGKVVYQTELMQLIQYQPATSQVYRRPLVIIPPWINKYYILDLREKNSFIRWAVERGHTVFVRSEEHTSELQSPDHLVC